MDGSEYKTVDLGQYNRVIRGNIKLKGFGNVCDGFISEGASIQDIN